MDPRAERAQELYFEIEAAQRRGSSDDVVSKHIEMAQLRFEEYLRDPDVTGFFTLMYHALMGDTGEANRVAREVDQHTFGPLSLILMTYWCQCGAPFDLEAAPNFAAMLEESGLHWPPLSPIDWPLKNF